MGQDAVIRRALGVAGHFDFKGSQVDLRTYGKGHINDTFLVSFRLGETTVRYILQRINDHVFRQPAQLMENVVRVTSYLRNVIAGAGGNPDRETLNVIPTTDGGSYYVDEEGSFWRAYAYIADAVSLELPENENDFYQSAVAFGTFQRMLGDFPAGQLHETIPDFHNTPVRYENFLRSVERAENAGREAADGLGEEPSGIGGRETSGAADREALARLAACAEEIRFVKERRAFMSVLEDSYQAGKLPKRVTHNDTKINNVMLDRTTRKPVCVIDLDTIMPGYSVTDFGDSIRFGASTALEDEPDLHKVHLDLNLFETYTRGFLAGCGGTLTEAEVGLMPEGAMLMTLECGMRFLTDYLDGNVYFKTAYPEHNLVRCRTQFKLVREMEDHWEELKRIVERCR